jgi:hypothetical protein
MVETTEIRTEILGGKPVEVTIRKRIGRAVYQTPRGPVEADEYIERDYGRGGIARSYGHLSEASPAESEKRTRDLQALAGRIALSCGA